MPPIFKTLRYRVGNEQVLEQMRDVQPRIPFDPDVIAFLQSFSKILLTEPQARPHSDVISLAFWCRKAALEQMKKAHAYNELLLGRGITFHIAPSNVAVNFAYSLFAGLLTGNANVVRLPSKPFVQVDIICQALNQTLEHHVAIRELICLVQYGHETEINHALSAMCQARMIWGGDKTIALIRQSPMSARAVDIAFADRYSIAVIQADAYLAADNKQRIAQNFYNDTLLTDQQACTSPKLVVWLGEQKAEARVLFWTEFEACLRDKPMPEAVSVVKTLADYCERAARSPELKYIPSETRRIFRVEAEKVTQDMLENHHGSGLFYEWLLDDISEMAPVCGEKCQTVATLGLTENNIKQFIQNVAPKGVDRIVAVGQTMEFTLHWDGYDLLKTLTRTITLSPGY
ncbi:acyl-CoA reductase [Lelliottia amnigena]|uniref:Acyl-CoA reductase n=1 Tax=Lelliottia amnigena TaxID=61646 RepID=A0AAP2AGY3_LELAM|nr:acyl-CoA reductase [Lelliottia amnigena]MBL5900879.1 acyl-CoA reductase [Lelliottia amnigena]MBL5936431.1 acyl-CoA reductase [Lelliottia amnigena]